jgi:hypothetical protein
MNYCNQHYSFDMVTEVRLLEVVEIDDLNPKILQKVLAFFNTEFFGLNSKPMSEEFFKSKIKQSDSIQRGFLTVAMFGDQVVGTCSAVRKEVYYQGRVVDAVEIGDTYTSQDFRRDCHFRELYPGTSTIDEYLNKSIFGRLVSETIDRATADGVEFVYGVPNQQSKVPYISKLNFQLIDANSTYRMSSPTITHPAIKRNLILLLLYRIYFQITLYFSLFATRNYEVKTATDFSGLTEISSLTTFDDNPEYLHLCTSDTWIKGRFLENSDKRYEIIQVKNKKSSLICGYLIFLIQEREDGFRLLILSKELLMRNDLKHLKLAFSRISSQKFFNIENMSMWIDLEVTKKIERFLYGYLARPIRVEIIAKNLSPDFLHQMTIPRFYDFQYGDSDLG